MADENNGAQGNENNGAQGNENQQNQGSSFVLDDATIDRIAEASSRKAADQHRNDQRNDAGSNDQNNGNNGNNSGGSNSGIPDWAAALPETIARAVKEAVGTPKAPENNGAQGNENNGAGGNENQGQEPGKSKSFAHWWFGVK